ncbi:MAG: hypothetical protein H6581_09750 [Bacteroidia bacterium]|nr:hypothetical protein [Bacteroidia bacterium]
MVPFLFYLLFFLALFLQFPLSGSLPGNMDTWLYLAEFNLYGNQLLSFLGLAPDAVPNFPEGNISLYGEPCYGPGLVFLLVKLFVRSDLWSWYVFISLLFSSSAYGAFLLADEFVKDKKSSLLAGFFFASSNFALASLDQPNAFAFFPAFVCLTFLIRFLKRQKRNHLIWAMLAGGLQVWFSSYIFVFLSLIMGLILLSRFRAIWKNRPVWAPLLTWSWIFILLALPFVWLFVWKSRMPEVYREIHTLDLLQLLSLDPIDLLRPLPRNLIYPAQSQFEGTELYQWRSAHLGILVWIFAILGVWKSGKTNFGWVLVGLAGLFLAMGPLVELGNYQINSPMKWIYLWIPPLKYLKHISRAFFMCSLALSFFAAEGVLVISQRFGKRFFGAVLLILLIFWIENVPAGLEKFSSRKFLDLPPELTDKLRSNREGTVLFLPAYAPFFPEENSPEKEYENGRRMEYIYMYWQTQIMHNSPNAANSYIPVQRQKLQEEIDLFRESGNPSRLINLNQLGWVVVSKSASLWNGDNLVEKFLSPGLGQLEFSNEKFALIRVIKGPFP